MFEWITQKMKLGLMNANDPNAGNPIATMNDINSLINYKVYSCLLTQLGSSAPTIIVLQNTIGDIVWTRHSTGIYYATLSKAFTINKTDFNICDNDNNGNGGPDDYIIYGMVQNDSNVIQVQTANITLGSGGGIALGDGLLSITPVQIRVYN